MNEENLPQKQKKIHVGKECAYLAVFVALVIAAQLCLSAVAGVEVVTVLFAAYAFTFGAGRGMLAATAFSLLRMLVFGFLPQVLVLYLLYYNAFTLLFGALGERLEEPLKRLWLLILLACIATLIFSALDLIINALWYAYSWAAIKVYALASLPVAATQVVCAGVSVGVLFMPLHKTFSLAKKWLS